LHQTVLLDETIRYLAPEQGDIILDATVGGGGHSERIIREVAPDGRVIGIDRDATALEEAEKRLGQFKENIDLVRSDFRDLKKILAGLGIGLIDGIIFDLGVSSFQLDRSDKGFSYKNEGPLDMRMDNTQPLTAETVVNEFAAEQIADILKEFGEERYSRIIAGEIVKRRKGGRINTTRQLAGIIEDVVGSRYRGQRLDAPVRSFQALRIFVNDELGSLKEALDESVSVLKVGGRIVVISFHSLEDRIVKRAFREMSSKKQLNPLTKKPVRPGEDEIKRNRRARSARLRAAERIFGAQA
jgi:16S rRNA (cytosine1402-N4)-methyltransferase